MVNGALTIVWMCAYCPFPPLILHSLLDEDICSILSQWILFSRSQYAYQVQRLYFLYLLYLPFLQNLTWWWWIFSRTMQTVILRRWKKILQREKNNFGQNQCQLSAKFIGSKGRWGPTSPLALGSWLSKTYSVFYWHITPDHTAKKPRNCSGTSLLQKAGGHLILMEMSTLYPFSKITQCILFVRLEQKP